MAAFGWSTKLGAFGAGEFTEMGQTNIWPYPAMLEHGCAVMNFAKLIWRMTVDEPRHGTEPTVELVDEWELQVPGIVVALFCFILGFAVALFL